MKQTYITTSWDDGHPLDLRVAELLTKYGLHGTFYIPKAARERDDDGGTDPGAEQRFRDWRRTPSIMLFSPGARASRLGRKSSVPSLGLKKTQVCRASRFVRRRQVFASRHVDMVRKAGYLGLRTVEMLSLDLPRQRCRTHAACRPRFRLIRTAPSPSRGTRSSGPPSAICGGLLLTAARPSGRRWRDPCCVKPSHPAACSISGAIHGSCRKPDSGSVWMKSCDS